jgi:retron-type reverse transcriptase
MKRCPVTFENVASLENLCAAWEEFIRGKRKKEDVQAFAKNLADEIVRLHEDLMAGTYRHGPYVHFRIRDPKPRDIHKASVRDRLLHHAIHRQLYPFYDRLFIADSFSCRVDKGVHRALDRFRMMARKASKNHTRTCWALKCDIRKFFASIDHKILLDIFSERITDKWLLNLLSRIIESFETLPGKGVPLGNLTSQLCANVYLDALDQFVKRFLRAEHYIRYADDFIFLSSDKEHLISFLPLMQAFLRDRLNLALHPDKTFLQTIASGVDFLGWIHFPYHRVPRTVTRHRLFSRLRQRPEEATLQSYLGMLSHGDAWELQRHAMNERWLWNNVSE